MKLDQQEARALVLEKLSNYLDRPVNEDDLNKGYEELGADSMDMVALAFELEQAAEIKILPEVFLQYESIGAAMEAILANPHD